MQQTDHAEPIWIERHPRIALTVLLAVCLIGMDLIAGTLFKVGTGYPFMDRGHAPAWEAYLDTEQRYRVSSDVYDHGLAPNKAVEGVTWGPLTYRIRTNSLGFKDRAVREVPLQTDRHRILFIGDSFTEGIGVNYEHTFVGLIDSALSGQNVEVLNAAATSYSPIIYWRKVKHLVEDVGLRFDELVVYIDISDAYNDGALYYLDADESVRQHDMTPKPGLLGAVKNGVLRHTVLLPTLYQLRGGDAPAEAAGFPLDHGFGLWTTDAATYQQYGEKGVAAMQRHMDQLHDLMQARGIPMTVAVYPWPGQIAKGDLHSRQVAVWQAWCERRGVAFLNYFPAFVKGAGAAERMQVLWDYYIPGDTHWNAAGHRVVADHFLAWYRGDHVRPQATASPPVQTVSAAPGGAR